MEIIEIKDVGNSEKEITATIPVSEYEKYRASVLKKLGESMEIDGFRKGNVPEDIIEKKAGEVTVLHEMASEAIAEAYPKIVEENQIQAIGRPEVSITKLAKGNPIEFKAKTAVVPEIELPDYKKIAQEVLEKNKEETDSVEVSDDDVDKTILEIRTNWAKQMEQVKKASTQDSDGSKDVGETKEKEKQEEPLPELTDEFVKQLGDFENIADFKEKLKQNLKDEKKSKAQEKQRLAIIDAIIDKTKLTPPEVLITGELDRMMAQFKDNVAMMGQNPEDYFKQIGKTEDEVKEGWRNDALKRVTTQLVLQKIAEEEKVTPNEEEIEKQVKQVMEQYPDARKEQARGYVENILTNEKTFELLENQEK